MKGKHFTPVLIVLVLSGFLGVAQAAPVDKPKDDEPQKYDPLQKVRAKFEDGDYESVLKSVKDLRGSAVKLTAEQRGQLGLWEGESLLRTGKYAEAERALATISVGDSDPARRALEIDKVLKPTLPSGKLNNEPLSDPGVLERALTAAGEPVAAETDKLLATLAQEMESDKSRTALEKSSTTDVKKSKYPWQRSRDRVMVNLLRLEALQPDKARDLAIQLAEKECKTLESAAKSVMRQVDRNNPLEERMNTWWESDRVTITSWRGVQDKARECAASVLALRSIAYLLGQSKNLPAQFGAEPFKTRVDPDDVTRVGDETARILDEMLKSDRPKSSQVRDWRESWEEIDRGSLEDENSNRNRNRNRDGGNKGGGGNKNGGDKGGNGGGDKEKDRDKD